jgi:hypothetical protein
MGKGLVIVPHDRALIRSSKINIKLKLFTWSADLSTPEKIKNDL